MKDPPEKIRAQQDGQTVAVETGSVSFRISGTAGSWLQASCDGRELIQPGSSLLILRDPRGRPVTSEIEEVTLVDRGPVRTTARVSGRFTGRSPCRFTARFCFFAGTGLVRLRLTIHNSKRARRRGGIWDLGDPKSILFQDLSLEFALAGEGKPRVIWTAEPNQETQVLDDGPLEIYQDSSGGENWRSRNHVNREGRVPCSFRGYRVRAGGREESGLRASPTVTVQGEAGFVAAAIPEFWQQFPKALGVEGRTLRARLFPGQFGDLFELQGGERKTHTLWLAFGSADEPAEGQLDWVHRPSRVLMSSELYADSGAIPHLLPAEPLGRLEAEMAGVVEGPRRFAARRETIDEYGWRNFGEVYADHEAAYYPGELPVISHYNNQYDLVLGMILQYLRTGDGRWFDLFDPLARHVVDIDIYHTNRDKSAYNGGLFWHTDHYRDAATCTHRAFSRSNRPPGGGPYGGGPSSEHNYTTGLLHYYYLTGEEDALAAVLGLADWVIAKDDGQLSIFGWLDPSATGSASRTAEWNYHGPGRGAGNSINALLDGWLASGSRRYLRKAEELIRRTIHPADDIEAHGLLNTETRWSYTVHLSALARYLALKEEAGEIDRMYAYTQAALLHYARWMLEKELPYFERPEQLEYPTETWAAQEFRKANVLRLAASHADEPLRSRLLERGEELADRAWADLLRFESRDVARAVAILMREGVIDAWFRARTPEAAMPATGFDDFGPPQVFIAQKDRVRALLRSPSGLARAAFRLAGSLLGYRPRPSVRGLR